MRRLDTYILFRLVVSFLLVMFIITVLIGVVNLFGRLEDFLESGSTDIPGLILRYQAANMPILLMEVIPALLLIAACATTIGLNRRNEFTAMKAAGINIHRALLPIALFAILVGALTAYLREVIIQQLQERKLELERILEGKKIAMNILVTDGEGNVFFMERFCPSEKIMHGLTVVRRDTKGREVSRILADQCKWVVLPDGGAWETVNGRGYIFDTEGRRVKSDVRYIRTDLQPRSIELSGHERLEPTIAETLRLLERFGHYPRLEVQLQNLLASPFTSIVLIMVGIPLVLAANMRNVFIGVGLAILLGGLFYAATSIGLNLGNHGHLHPILAGWLPTVVFFFLGVILTARMPA